jgi:hypothetical protein
MRNLAPTGLRSAQNFFAMPSLMTATVECEKPSASVKSRPEMSGTLRVFK